MFADCRTNPLTHYIISIYLSIYGNKPINYSLKKELELASSVHYMSSLSLTQLSLSYSQTSQRFLISPRFRNLCSRHFSYSTFTSVSLGEVLAEVILFMPLITFA